MRHYSVFLLPVDFIAILWSTSGSQRWILLLFQYSPECIRKREFLDSMGFVTTQVSRRKARQMLTSHLEMGVPQTKGWVLEISYVTETWARHKINIWWVLSPTWSSHRDAQKYLDMVAEVMVVVLENFSII